MSEDLILKMKDFQSFRIGFDSHDKKWVHECWNEIISSQKWAEGEFTQLFEEKRARWNSLRFHGGLEVIAEERAPVYVAGAMFRYQRYYVRGRASSNFSVKRQRAGFLLCGASKTRRYVSSNHPFN